MNLTDIDTSSIKCQEILTILNELKNEQTKDELGKILSNIVKFKKKYTLKKPKLILNSNFKTYDEADQNGHTKQADEKQTAQIFVQDIQKLVLSSLLQQNYRYLPQWCKILRSQYVNSVVLITLNNFSETEYIQHKRHFDGLFDKMDNNVHLIEFVSSSANNSNFFNEFVSVPMLHNQWLNIRDTKSSQEKLTEVVKRYTRLFNENAKVTCDTDTATAVTAPSTHELDKISRLSVLLNLEQMIKEDYPVCLDDIKFNLNVYKYSQKKYKIVTHRSPLYAMDCEMCYNIDGDLEVVWIAIVNEQLECIYETYVKPMKTIVNYLTRITGVDENTLKDITIQLDEVQRQITKLLPRDAILCGHSLNNDLHALKLFHPYVIDTSVIYNLSGSRDFKPSLRNLAAQFLGRIIQEGKHNPVIDAKATMQLVLLKLRQSLDFGDVIINGCTDTYSSTQLNMNLDVDMSTPDKISSYIYKTGLNITQTTFDVLDFYKVPNVYIDQIDRNTNDNTLIVDDNEEALETLKEQLDEKKKFLWCQLYAKDNEDKSGEIKSILKKIHKIYKKSGDDTFLMILLAGDTDHMNRNGSDTMAIDCRNLYKGRCFIKHKNSEIDALDNLIRTIANRKNSIE